VLLLDATDLAVFETRDDLTERERALLAYLRRAEEEHADVVAELRGHVSELDALEAELDDL
jgi:hypothetical protein